jgi:hypothetical protein
MSEIIRPGQPSLEVPVKMQWAEKEELREVLTQGGFEEGKVEVGELEVYFEADDVEDLANRLATMGPAGLAKAQGWNEEEIGRIEGVLASVLGEFTKEVGGKVRVPMVAWIAKATK